MKPPSALIPGTYKAVRHLLPGNPADARPLAGVAFGRESDPIEQAYRHFYDFSLARQLYYAQRYARPHLYIHTAYSAIPVADTIRGYYSALGMQIPDCTYVMAKKGADDLAQAGAARIGALLNGFDQPRVCIVDQYTMSGETLLDAEHIARAAGAASIRLIAGHWYHDASRADIDLGLASSCHHEFMYGVGEQIAEQTNRAK